jgi:hypothetical protein
VVEKKKVIQRIGKLENLRQNAIKKINSSLGKDDQILSLNKLIRYIGTNPIERDQRHFLRFNDLLMKLIEKLKQQNKRNQLFINKAMISLNDWKKEALGHKSFQTYTSSGTTISKGA